MEIFPYKLFLLLLSSFLFGMSGGAINDIWRICRCFLGVRYSEAGAELYRKKLPFVGELGKRSGDGRWRRVLLWIVVFFQDLLLFTYLGCGSVALNFYFNSGEFRIYTVAAVSVGFLVYYFTIGRLVTRVSEIIVFFIRAALRMILFLLSRPLVAFFKLISAAAGKILSKIRNTLAKKKNMCYNDRERKRFLKMAENGFQK